jgi:hypothetical protein
MRIESLRVKTFSKLDVKTKMLFNDLSLTSRLSYPVHMSKEGNVPADYSSNVTFFLNPGCVYELSIKPSIPSMWGQIVRVYSPMVFSFVVSATLLTFAQQIKAINEKKTEV